MTANAPGGEGARARLVATAVTTGDLSRSITVETAGEAVLMAFDSGETGQAFLLQAGRDVMTYRFRGIPGPLAADGSPARSTRPSSGGSSGCGSATRSPRTPATSTA